MSADPAEAHLFHRRTFGFRTNKRSITGTMCLAESMTSSGECNGLLVIHRHPRESFANILGTGEWVGVAVRTLRIHINQTHLNRGKGMGEIALTTVPAVAQPISLDAPIDVFFRRPDVSTATTETERSATHGFDGDIASQNQQIGPADIPAIFLLDRPQQATRLVQIAIIGPAVQRRKTLRTRATATTTICGSVGAGSVPCHADEKRTIMPIIGWPPLLRVGHETMQILLQRLVIKRIERLGIVKIRIHRICLGRMLVQDVEIELVRPPIPCCGTASGCIRQSPMHYRASVFTIHDCLQFFWVVSTVSINTRTLTISTNLGRSSSSLK